MRKYFEGHSLVGVTLILISFLFALFLRFYQLDSLSPWNDELATWWYTGHLSEVFRSETHSPLYYGILRLLFGETPKILQLRYFSAVLSVVHLVECYFLGQQVFKKSAFLVFWILICLSPVDIIYARMARHYAWFLEGTIVFYLLWKWDRYRWLNYLVATCMSFIHVFFLIPFGVLTLWRFFKKRNVKDLALSGLSGSIVVIYYLVKFFQFGQETMLQNISWVVADNGEFFVQLVTQFLGGSSPRYFFFPIDPVFGGVILALILGFVLFKRKASGKIFVVTFVLTFALVTLAGPWNNFRINRYFIYLVSLLIVAIADAVEDMSEMVAVGVLFLSLGLLVWVNPIKYFPGDREAIQFWRSFEGQNPVAQKIVCSLSYQAAYFGLNSTESCEKQLGKIDPRLPLLYFDLNGSYPHHILMLMKSMRPTEFRKVSRGLIVRFDPKDKSDAEK